MRIYLVCFGAVMALFLVGSALCASSPYTVVAPDRQAVAAANKWLSVMDASNYTQAYAMFPARIRSGGDAIEKQCIGIWRARRTPLGRTLSRRFAKAYFGRTLA